MNKNNKKLVENIRGRIDQLGLLINEYETVASSEFLNYGKLVTLWEN